eukprot:765826-Hanusia_phi.AAC.5
MREEGREGEGEEFVQDECEGIWKEKGLVWPAQGSGIRLVTAKLETKFLDHRMQDTDGKQALVQHSKIEL